MAEALFAAGDLSPDALRRLAAKVGVDAEDYDAGAADPALDEALRWAQKALPQGLPGVWVQDELLGGAQTAEGLRAALARHAPGGARALPGT